MALNGVYSNSYYLPSVQNRLSYRSISGYKTKPIGSTVTAYTMEMGRARGYYSNAGMVHSLGSAVGISSTQRLHNTYDGALKAAYDNAYARAYSSVQQQLSSQAANLTAIVEAGSSLDMITKRVTSMTRAYRALKRGKFREFLNLLSVQEPLARHRRTRWTNPKDASALWLEYWFGWAPALADIYTSLEILYNLTPFAERVVVGKGSGFYSSGPVESKAPGSSTYYDFTSEVYVRLSCAVTVTNPNLFLLARLGLLNPASTALEVVPFSWLLNWFTNVGSYVQSWSDDYGLTYGDVWWTLHVKTSGLQAWKWDLLTKEDGYAYDCIKTRRARDAALRKPPLRWNFPDRLSVTRAATAISLITLLFAPDAGVKQIPRKI